MILFITILSSAVLLILALGFYPLWRASKHIKARVGMGLLLCFTVIIPFIALYDHFGAPIIITLQAGL
jgi:Na+-translocating ferredoxin:NAD+ oxidoreductase RnfA subunit